MSDLATTLDLYYNGFTFPTETEVVDVDIKPILDPARRTVTHTVHTYVVRFYLVVTQDDELDSSDTLLSVARQKLTQIAGEFLLEGLGFSTVHVNQPGGAGKRDVAWGPIPEILSCKNKGADRAWELTWRVSVAILDQCESANYRFQAMHFCYQTSWIIATNGLQTRRYHGTLRVPQTRLSSGDRKLNDHADAYREQIIPPLLLGFQRVPGTFTLSEDKCTLTFDIQDIQLPSHAPPPFLTNVRASHSAESANKGFIQWVHTFHWSCEVIKGHPRTEAWKYFYAFVKDRREEMKKRAGGGTLILTKLVASEPEIYGSQSASFTATVLQSLAPGPIKSGSVAAAIKKAIYSLSLWKRPPSDDPAQWRQSMVSSGAWRPGGLANLRFDNDEDLLIDLCLDRKPVGLAAEAELRPAAESRIDDLLRQPPPKPEESWLDYRLISRVVEKDDNVHLKPLPQVNIKERKSFARANSASNAGSPATDDTTGFELPYTAAPDHIIQRRAAPSAYIILEGSAIRAGYAITPPQIREYNGVAVTPMNEGSVFSTQVVYAADGTPVAGAAWRLIYLLNGLPTRPTRPLAAPLVGGMDTQ